MSWQKNSGFTIIEVIIFVAISGLLVIVAMQTIGSKQSLVQFTDAMRDIEGFFQTQNSDAVNGVNDNPITSGSCIKTGEAGTTLGCVILGRAAIMRTNTIDYFTVLGETVPTGPTSTECPPHNLLRCTALETEQFLRSYNYLWGVTFTGGTHINNSGLTTVSDGLAFLRNPRSTTIEGVSYRKTISNTADKIPNNVNYKSNSPQATIGPTVKAQYCFISSNSKYKAAIELNNTQTNLVFEPTVAKDGYTC